MKGLIIILFAVILEDLKMKRDDTPLLPYHEGYDPNQNPTLSTCRALSLSNAEMENCSGGSITIYFLNTFF